MAEAGDDARDPGIRRTVHRAAVVDGRAVGMDVDVLEADARQQLAASIAWLSREELTSGLVAWQAFASNVVAAHVAFTVDDGDLLDADATWWARVVYAGASALMDVNALAPTICRSLSSLAAAADGGASVTHVS